jgi:hypothetical protein
VECIITDPNHSETRAELMEKYKRLNESAAVIQR